MCFDYQVLGTISTVSVDVCLEKSIGYSAEIQVKNVLGRELEKKMCPRLVMDCTNGCESNVKFRTQLQLVA